MGLSSEPFFLLIIFMARKHFKQKQKQPCSRQHLQYGLCHCSCEIPKMRLETHLLPPINVVRREGNVFTGVSLSVTPQAMTGVPTWLGQDWDTPQERTWDQRPGKEPGTGVPNQKGPGTRDLEKSLGLAYPHMTLGQGYPQPGQDWGTHLAWTGVPPRLGLGYLPPPPPPPRQNNRVTTCYTVGGMVLAVTQEGLSCFKKSQIWSEQFSGVQVLRMRTVLQNYN